METSRSYRPAGITALSIIHLSSSIFFIIVIFYSELFRQKETEELAVMTPIDSSLLVTILAPLFLVILAFFFCRGMWTGKKWAWFLGSFLHLSTVIKTLTKIATILIMGDYFSFQELMQATEGPGFYLKEHSVSLAANSLVYFYFYQDNVLAYFDLENLKQAKTVAIQILLCMTLIAVPFLWR